MSFKMLNLLNRKVEIAQWPQRATRFASLAEQFILPLVSTNVCLRSTCLDGFKIDPQDERFWIVVGGSYVENVVRDVVVPNVVLGVSWTGTAKACRPGGRGIPILDERTGFCVAELVERCLFFTVRFLQGDQEELDLFRCVLARVAQLLLEGHVPECESDLMSRDSEDVVAALQWSTRSRISELSYLAQGASEKLEAYTFALNTSKENLRSQRIALGMEERLRKSLGCETQTRAHARQVFDQIMRLPYLRWVPLYDGKNLSVFTRNVACQHRVTKNVHELGCYRLAVPASKAQAFGWFNLTRRVQGLSEGMSHPHVYASGDACQGNFSNRLQEVLDQGDVFSAIVLGVQFLRNAHIADAAGKHLKEWPVLEKYQAPEGESYS